MTERNRASGSTYRRLRTLMEGCAHAQRAADKAESPEKAREIRAQLERTMAAAAREGTRIKLPPPASKSSRSAPQGDRVAAKRRRMEGLTSGRRVDEAQPERLVTVR